MASRRPARIYVLAGVNGAGKSSIGGAMFAVAGSPFFDPDAAAKRFLDAEPGMGQANANRLAWHEGVRLLERAIHENLDFAFETTLGGNTIASLLAEAASRGHEVRVWYVGLEGEKLHIARVRSRVARGGHDIAEEKIRERYATSRLHLIALLPKLTELRLLDNSIEGDPGAGHLPAPRLLLHWTRGKIINLCELQFVPEWAKPVVQAALHLSAQTRK